MNTNEAAKAMLNGEICDCNGYEYSWAGVSFCRAEKAGGVSKVDCLPSSEEWEIVKKPIKYSRELWMCGEPNMRVNSPSLITYLFGHMDIFWSSKKYNEKYKKYKITVEEIKEE